MPRNTIEEKIIADADVLAHFDAIPSLFSLAFNEMELNLHDGTEFVKDKLKRDYDKLSDKTRNEESSLFAVKRDRGLESIIGNIYQSFAGQDIYKSIEEKNAIYFRK